MDMLDLLDSAWSSYTTYAPKQPYTTRHDETSEKSKTSVPTAISPGRGLGSAVLQPAIPHTRPDSRWWAVQKRVSSIAHERMNISL